MNKANGIFLELDRWLGETNRQGVMQIGNFSADIFETYRKCGFEEINYISDEDISKFDDKCKILAYIKDKTENFKKYNVLAISSIDNEYDIVSAGLPKKFDVIIVRYHRKSAIGIDILIDFMNFLKYSVKYTAEHKDKILTDLYFIRQK